jgi:spore coat polysaccharide biosynthesis protein SpsF
MNYIFIQARMGSTRLPGKVLKEIGGNIQLQHLINRLLKSAYECKFIVVTTSEKKDSEIVDFCLSKKISFFRGSENDVLDRFYKCAKEYDLKDEDTIVRVTADCPMHHYLVLDFALKKFSQHKLDYFTNSFAPIFEDGCDCEVFKFSVLEKTWKIAKLLSQREHVTPFIKDSGIFLCGYKKYHPDYNYKLSVDTFEDYLAIDGIFKKFATADFSIDQVIDLLKLEPELLNANKKSIINSGYYKSLENDKEIN